MNRRKAHIIAQNGNSNSLSRRGLLAYVVSRSIYSKEYTLAVCQRAQTTARRALIFDRFFETVLQVLQYSFKQVYRLYKGLRTASISLC